MVKNRPANAGDVGSIPGSGRSPGEENGNHSSILTWRFPWTEESDGLQPMSNKELDTTEQLTHTRHPSTDDSKLVCRDGARS